METTTKEIIREIINKELERIKEKLTPHFKNFGELYIIHDSLSIDIDGSRYTILCMNTNGTIDNSYNYVHNAIGIESSDVFEETGVCLEEIKVKPFKTFDTEEWKREFVEKYNLHIDKMGFITDDSGYLVISTSDDINYKEWHKRELTGHSKFKFDGHSNIHLETKQDCLEFEAIFKEYMESQKYKTLKQLFPNLTVEEREEIGLVFADIARSLNIDIMYDKAEEDYFCNAYRIDRDKADLILNLIKGENNAK